MVFFYFLNFFTIFMVFSITLRVGTKQNNNFYFLSFSAFSNLFWLVMKPQWYFFNFLNFFLFFQNFLLRVGQERNGTIIFISLFRIHFQPILARNEFILVFFNFLNFFVIFLEFSVTPWVGMKRNDNFYFFSFPSFSNLFWFEMISYWYFLIFEYFCVFF